MPATSNNKYLVNLIHGLAEISHRHLFVVAWVGIAAFFAFLMVQSYRRSVRRNFRPSGNPARVPGRPGTPRLEGTPTKIVPVAKKKD